MKQGDSTDSIDFYAVLGVAPDADQVVVRAACKALVQRYHPDKFAGDPALAEQTTRRILAAYAVLSDPAKRAEYDRSRSRSGSARTAAEEGDAAGGAPAMSWAAAVARYPDLEALTGRLQRISVKLADAYKSHLIAENAYRERESVAQAFEARFLEYHFGPHEELVAFARKLIGEGNQTAAWTFYQSLKSGDPSIDPGAAIARFCREHGMEPPRAPADAATVRPPEAGRRGRSAGSVWRSRAPLYAGVVLVLGFALWSVGRLQSPGYGPPPAPALKAGDLLADCEGCPELVVVPPGEIEMETDLPAYRVSIMYPMAVSRYPISFEEWERCVLAGGCTRPDSPGTGTDKARTGNAPAEAADGRRPVTHITWEQAQEYVTWLSRRTGKVYRLPSETELKHAARAVPVARSSEPMSAWKPNAFGVYGNDFEWVADCAHPSYRGAPADGRAWVDDRAEQNDLDRAVGGLEALGNPAARARRCAARVVSFAEGRIPFGPLQKGRPTFRVARALIGQ